MGVAATKINEKMEVSTWMRRLEEEAEISAGAEPSAAGAFISTRGGRLSIGGAEIPGNAFSGVVLDSVLENQFYKERFNPDKPSSPVCFSFGRDEASMAPHEDSPDPQHATCKGCPMNEWSSADEGRGKACKNVRRLAIITEDSMDDIESAEVRYLKLPVMSVKGWVGYVKQLKDVMKRPPFSVITEIRLVPDAKSQFRVVAKFVGQIEDTHLLDQLFELRERVKGEIGFPYQVPAEEESPAPKKGAAKGKPAQTAKPQRKF